MLKYFFLFQGQKHLFCFFPKHFKKFLRMCWYLVCPRNKSNVKIFELRKHLNEWSWHSWTGPKRRKDALEYKLKKRRISKIQWWHHEMLGIQTGSGFYVNDRELLVMHSGVDETEWLKMSFLSLLPRLCYYLFPLCGCTKNP